MGKPVTKSNMRYALRQSSTVPMITTYKKKGGITIETLPQNRNIF
jgi:hypothetical protein